MALLSALTHPQSRGVFLTEMGTMPPPLCRLVPKPGLAPHLLGLSQFPHFSEHPFVRPPSSQIYQCVTTRSHGNQPVSKPDQAQVGQKEKWTLKPFSSCLPS